MKFDHQEKIFWDFRELASTFVQPTKMLKYNNKTEITCQTHPRAKTNKKQKNNKNDVMASNDVRRRKVT